MALWSCWISLHKLVAGVKCSAWMATDININVQHDSPLNHGINCGRRNEQVVSQPFLFWFGLSSSSLDKFPFFLLSFPFFPLFICLCIYVFFLFLFFFFSSIFFLFTTSFYSFSSSSFVPSSSPFFFLFNSSSYFSSRFTSSLFSFSFSSLSGRK